MKLKSTLIKMLFIILTIGTTAYIWGDGPHCGLQCWDFGLPTGSRCVSDPSDPTSECFLWWTPDGWECAGYADGCPEAP